MAVDNMQIEDAEDAKDLQDGGSKVVASVDGQAESHVVEFPPANNDKVGAPGQTCVPSFLTHRLVPCYTCICYECCSTAYALPSFLHRLFAGWVHRT